MMISHSVSKYFFYDFQNLKYIISRDIWAKIFSVRVLLLTWCDTSFYYLREFVFCDFDIQEVFIIFEEDIVPRKMFFDERIFEYETFCFIIRHDILDVSNLFYHQFFRKIEFWGSIKITIYTRLKIFWFSNIDDGILRIKKLVDSRTMRKGRKDIIEMFHCVNRGYNHLFHFHLGQELVVFHVWIMGAQYPLFHFFRDILLPLMKVYP